MKFSLLINIYCRKPEGDLKSSSTNPVVFMKRKGTVFESSRHPADREDFEATGNEIHFTPNNKGKKQYL